MSIPLVPETLKPGPVPEQEVALVLVHLRLTWESLLMFLSSSPHMPPGNLPSKTTVGGFCWVLVMVILLVAMPPGPVQVMV